MLKLNWVGKNSRTIEKEFPGTSYVDQELCNFLEMEIADETLPETSDQTETNKKPTGQCSCNEVSDKIWSLKASSELPKKKKIRIIEDNSEGEIESIADVVEVDHSDLIDDHHVLLRMTKADIIKVYDKPQSNDFYKTRSSKNSRSSLLAIALVGERLIMTGEITREFWRDEEVKLQESSFLLDLYSDIEWEGIRWILKNMHNKYKQNKNSNFSNFVAEARSIMRALRSTQGK
nr:uncharacterized protein LOC124809919 [Hydra vulgaris]